MNYCIISHNIAQYREISRTRQPRPRPKGHVRAKRPLINTPYKNSRPQTLVTLDHRRSIGRASRRGRAARTMNLGGGKRGRRAENRAKSPDIARYRVISHIIAKYRGDDIVKGYGEGRDTVPSGVALKTPPAAGVGAPNKPPAVGAAAPKRPPAAGVYLILGRVSTVRELRRSVQPKTCSLAPKQWVRDRNTRQTP